MRRNRDRDRWRENSAGKNVIRIVITVIFIICVIDFLNWLTEDDGVWTPDYSKIDLEDILGKRELTDEDYHTILMQTGLGRDPADILLSENTGVSRGTIFEKYQDNFFASGNYECRNVAVIVYEEKSRDKDGNLVQGFEIPDLRDGDILLTKATHSLGWRHGHAAIVTDASKGETLEAILLGTPSILQNVEKWRNFPSFIQLRLKDRENADPEQIAKYAKKEILGIPYSIFAGIPVKAPGPIKKTQCSHLVWYPYERFGYDLDSDGSWLVTPKDIANSDLLEIVQVYGVDPDDIWP